MPDSTIVIRPEAPGDEAAIDGVVSAAFLPQFIEPTHSLWLQFAIMAATFAGIEILTELTIASLAHRIRPWLRRVGRRFNQSCGAIFMVIGAALPLRA